MKNLNREEFERDLKLRDVNWFYSGTTRIWESFLTATLKGTGAAGRALDLGCGIGGKAEYLKKFSSKVCGLDLSFDALEFCKVETALPLCQATMEQLPYKDDTFSLVSAFDVLEHVEDDAAALGEIRRVMSDSGHLVIAVPAFMMLWSQHDIANFHKRRYDALGLKKKLADAGFAVKRVSYINFFLFPVALIIRFFQYKVFRNAIENKRTRTEDVSGFMNSLLKNVLYLESKLIKNINFPFGVAIVCIAQKTRAGSCAVKVPR